MAGSDSKVVWARRGQDIKILLKNSSTAITNQSPTRTCSKKKSTKIKRVEAAYVDENSNLLPLQ
jgi:hypothetical protein